VPAEVEHDADTQMPREDEPQKPTKRKVKRKAKTARVPAEVEHDADTQMPMEEDPARAAQMNTLPGITYDFGDEPGLWNTTWEVNETRMPINESEANGDNTPLPAIDPSLINLRYDGTRVQAGNDDLAEHPALTAGKQIPGTDNGRQVPILIIPSLPSGRSTMMSATSAISETTLVTDIITSTVTHGGLLDSKAVKRKRTRTADDLAAEEASQYGALGTRRATGNRKYSRI
jgi:hypothetical protein